METLRNTPALLEEGFLEECKANKVIKVTQECFERTLLAQCKEENQESPLCMLEVLEDYNQAYVFDGQYFVGTSFLARHALI